MKTIWVPVVVEDSDTCSVECPWLLHKDDGRPLFCHLSGMEVPNQQRSRRCISVCEKRGVLDRALAGEGENGPK